MKQAILLTHTRTIVSKGVHVQVQSMAFATQLRPIDDSVGVDKEAVSRVKEEVPVRT
jgi:hypothetical protein